MSDDTEEAKRVSFSIIDNRRGTPEEPSEYILVPFNDPGSHMAYLVIHTYIYCISVFPTDFNSICGGTSPGGIYNFKIKKIIYLIPFLIPQGNTTMTLRV